MAMKEEDLRKAFPEIDQEKKKKKKKDGEEEEKNEIDLTWFFFVLIIGAGIFAGSSSYFKTRAEPVERPRHLRGTPIPTPTPDRIPRGYRVDY